MLAWSFVPLALVASVACGGTESPAQYDPASVTYQGPPFGDFVTLANAVRTCMHSQKQTLPRIILVPGIFQCYTSVGWRDVFGCGGGGEVFMDAHELVDSMGALWSHELTHYFGDAAENDPCGALAIQGFSIAQPDGGAGK